MGVKNIIHYFMQFIKQKLERIKHIFNTDSEISFEEEEEVKMNERWRFTDLKKVVDRMNFYAGTPFDRVKYNSKLMFYYIKLNEINSFMMILELIYFTFCTKQDLLGFISTCK